MGKQLQTVGQSVVDEPAETLHVPPVFLDKQQASSVISRQKRNVDGSNPAPSSSLEQVCMEKVCSYEEARKIFQDSYRTVSSRTSLLTPSSFPSLFKPPQCLLFSLPIFQCAPISWMHCVNAIVQLQLCTYAYFLLQDIFWSVYIGKCYVDWFPITAQSLAVHCIFS